MIKYWYYLVLCINAPRLYMIFSQKSISIYLFIYEIQLYVFFLPFMLSWHIMLGSAPVSQVINP